MRRTFFSSVRPSCARLLAVATVSALTAAGAAAQASHTPRVDVVPHNAQRQLDALSER